MAVQTASATWPGETSPAIGLGLSLVTAHIPASLTNVGQITETPTPEPQSSSRSARPKPRTANLVALYMVSPPDGSLPAIDDMNTMWPDLRSSIAGRSFAARTMPARRLTAIARSISSTLHVTRRPVAGIPALDTSTPTWPASLASPSGSPATDRSAATMRESPSSSASLSSAASLRAERTNLAPSLRSLRAMCGPRPVDAPVRRTAFPWRSCTGRTIRASFISDSPDRPASGGRNTRMVRTIRGWVPLGRLSHRPGRALRLVGDLELGFERIADRALRDDAALDLRTRRDLEHRVEKRLFDDRLQGPGAGATQERKLGDRVERPLLEDELHVVQREELLVLLHERVLGLGEDAHDVLLVEVVQGDDDRQAADDLRDEAVLQKVLRLQVLQSLGDGLALDLGVRATNTYRAAADALLDDLLQPVECAGADEEDVRRVDLDEILVRVLAPALRRYVGDGALEDLQQRLLDALAAHVACNRWVVRLARDLVDLVDVDDSAPRAADVEVGRLDEPEQDVLDVLADVAGLPAPRPPGDPHPNAHDPPDT